MSGYEIAYKLWFNEQIDSIIGIGNWKWNDTGVEIVLTNPDSHPEVLFKQVLDFFESIEVDLLKEASLKTVLNHYKWFIKPWTYKQTIEFLFDLSEQEWIKLIGVNGGKIYASLHRRLQNMKLETLCGSLNFCGFGFGIRKAKQLISQVGEDELWKLDEISIVQLNGFDEKTAKKIAKGLPAIKCFIQENSDYIKIIKERKTDELKGVSVVFTGFRDNLLESKVENMGGTVSTGISKKITYLVAADPDSTSGKAAKAKELRVKILSIDEFKDMFNL